VPRWRERTLARLNGPLLRLLLVLGLTALLLWTVVLFLPGGALIHQGSYLTMMVIMVSLAAILSTLPYQVLGPILGVQVGYFMIVWIITVEAANIVNWLGLVWMLVGLAALAACLVVIVRQPDDSDPTTDPTTNFTLRQRIPALVRSTTRVG